MDSVALCRLKSQESKVVWNVILLLLIDISLALAAVLVLVVASAAPAPSPPSPTPPSERPDHWGRQLRELLLALAEQWLRSVLRTVVSMLVL